MLLDALQLCYLAHNIIIWIPKISICDNFSFSILQIEEVGNEMFENIVKKDELTLSMDSPQEPESFPDYVEGWRI